MSTSDQQGRGPLTRKQMRELRLTGSTPVITPEEAAAAAAAAPPAPPAPRVPETVEVAPAPRDDSSVDLGAPPLTRRQARDQERIRTASVPVMNPDAEATPATPVPDEPQRDDLANTDHDEVPAEAEPQSESSPVVEVPAEHMASEPASDATDDEDDEPILSAVPSFVTPVPRDDSETQEDSLESEDITDAEIDRKSVV